MFRDDKLQDGIAQEFQPLIIKIAPLCLVAQARMRQRFCEQERIAKFVIDAFLERIQRPRFYPIG